LCFNNCVDMNQLSSELTGKCVKNLRQFFNGEIFLDKKKRFYEPREQKMGLLGFLCAEVWMNGLKAFRNDFVGNVLESSSSDKEGILLEHRKMEFRDKVNTGEVIQAARRISQELQLCSFRNCVFYVTSL
uniref:Selenoprotein U1b n=1 Tax=Stegastes partitus TaxID=144197 RepID=A0A3B4ZNG0_9TELE